MKTHLLSSHPEVDVCLFLDIYYFQQNSGFVVLPIGLLHIKSFSCFKR